MQIILVLPLIVFAGLGAHQYQRASEATTQATAVREEAAVFQGQLENAQARATDAKKQLEQANRKLAEAGGVADFHATTIAHAKHVP